MKYIHKIAQIIAALSICLIASASIVVNAMEIKANQWQLVSFPRLPQNATVDSVFGEAASNGQLTAVWTFNNNSKEWQSWPAHPSLDTSDLSELASGQGYWVKSSEDITLDLSDATETVGEMVLYPGWNLIGLSIGQTMGHEQAMAGVPFLELWKYDSNQNKFLAVQKSRGSQIILKEEFTDIESGSGLWVYMAEQSTLLPSMGTLLPPDIDIEPLLNLTEYGVETLWEGREIGVDVDWDNDGYFDFPNTQTIVAFGDFLNRQRISITNNGNGVLTWQAKVSDGANWLKFEVTDETGRTSYVSELSGSAADVNSAITLFADRVGKASGSENNAKVTITANGAVAEKVIDVSMEVSDIIGDYEVNIDLETIDSKPADLHNPKYFLSLARDGDGIKAFLDEERSLLIPSTTYLSGSYAGDPASNFQILGQITQTASDEQNPFGKPIRRQITYVGRRSDGMDGLSPLDLKGEYFENIYGVFDDPIQLRGTFVANRLSPIPVKQDEATNSIRDNIIPAQDTLLVDLDIDQRMSITEVITKLEIDHTQPEALLISLTSPQGTKLVLHKNSPVSVKKLSYDDADYSYDGLDLLQGQLSNGTWQLEIVNSSTSVGELTNWELDVSGAKVYQITGTVDPGIRLKISGCGITRTVTSGPDGSFVFDGLIPCDYEISVSQLGYEITSTTFTVVGCATDIECSNLQAYIQSLSSDQLAELAPKFIPSSNSMKVIASPTQATLSKDPSKQIILNGLDVTDYTAMGKTLQARDWKLYKRVNTTTEISADGYLVDVEYPSGNVPYGKNLIAYSEDFSQWSPTGSIALELANIQDPRGGYAAVKATHDGSGSSGAAIRSSIMGEGYFQVESGDYVTCSVFAKPDSVDELRIRFADGGTYITAEVMRISTGEYLAGADLQSKSTPLANGWYRIEATTTASADYSNFHCEFWMSNNGSLNLNTVESVYLYGPQAEITLGNGLVDYESSLAAVNQHPDPYNLNGWGWSSSENGNVTKIDTPNPSGQRYVNLCEQTGASFFTPIQHYASPVQVETGEKTYLSALIRFPVDTSDFGLQFVMGNNSDLEYIKIDSRDGSLITKSQGITNYKLEPLQDNFYLVQLERIYNHQITDAWSRITFLDIDNGEQAPIGSKAEIQAYYFGKTPLSNPYEIHSDFTNNIEESFWSAARYSLDVDQGQLKIISNGNDPQLFKLPVNSETRFDGNKYTHVAIRYRHNSGSNFNVLFFGNETSDDYVSGTGIRWGDNDGIYATTVGPDEDGFYYTELDLTHNARWTEQGLVTRLRFDFAGDATGTDTDIDFIKIYDPNLIDGYDVNWPATFTPPKALNEVFASAYIPSGPMHTERSTGTQQAVLISQGSSATQSWAHTLENNRANAGIYYLQLDSAVKDAADQDETLSYTTEDIHINYADTSGVHIGNFSVNAAAGSTSLSAMDSATFDINRPSVVDINPLKDSTNFSSQINPATETNVLEDVTDGVLHEPAGNLNNHYRMFISTGQLYHTGSMYGAEQRLDVGIQSQGGEK